MNIFLKKIINKFVVFIREKNNKIFGKKRLKKLNNPNFTIISNNCWAGHVYRFFNREYATPTIGLFFFQKDYIKFCSNLKHYVNGDLHFINYKDSKYYEYLEGKYSCPLGKIDDIEIVFLHYKSEKEAFEKWNRRCKRIIWDNIYIKNSMQGLFSSEDILNFEKLEFENKFIFTTKDFKINSQIFFDGGYLNSDNIANDTICFRKYIDPIKWLNNDPNYKLKQDKLRRKLK